MCWEKGCLQTQKRDSLKSLFPLFNLRTFDISSHSFSSAALMEEFTCCRFFFSTRSKGKIFVFFLFFLPPLPLLMFLSITFVRADNTSNKSLLGEFLSKNSSAISSNKRSAFAISSSNWFKFSITTGISFPSSQ